MNQLPLGTRNGKKRKRCSDSSLLLQLLYCFETPYPPVNTSKLMELFWTIQEIGQNHTLRSRREFLDILLDLSHSDGITDDQLLSIRSFLSRTFPPKPSSNFLSEETTNKHFPDPKVTAQSKNMQESNDKHSFELTTPPTDRRLQKRLRLEEALNSLDSSITINHSNLSDDQTLSSSSPHHMPHQTTSVLSSENTQEQRKLLRRLRLEEALNGTSSFLE